MKKILLYSVIIICYNVGFSQTACQNKQKVEELLKQEGSKNYGDRYNALERARFYWWRRCQCESGQVNDLAGEQTIIKYLATGYDNFQPYKGMFSDIPKPDQRDFSVGECYNGTEPNITISYGLDCTKEASSFLQTASDPQQYGKAFFAAYCECQTGGVSSLERAKQLEASMTMNLRNYNIYKAIDEPNIPLSPLTASQCLVNVDNQKNSDFSKSSLQTEMENRFNNYKRAMSFKNQGENLAKAFTEQVRNYSKLNEANSPEELLENFNRNMNAIAVLQAQNKEDNLNQINNTISSSINDLNAGNYEGAMFTALSLIDQGEAKREAKRKINYYKANLIIQAQEQMTAFYWKAVNLNNQLIEEYYKRAAFAVSKKEEDYLLKYVKHLECYNQSISDNFNYTNSLWLKNNCTPPQPETFISNNLIDKDVLYINAAQRKYNLFKSTGHPVFQNAAMSFSGVAASENPKIEYYYMMGHFAGIDNPIISYSSFLTVQNFDENFFQGDKKQEFEDVQNAISNTLKSAIDQNNLELIKAAINSNLHKVASIENQSMILYAIKKDNPDAVQLILNDYAEEESKEEINQDINNAIILSTFYNSAKIIQRFIDLGISMNQSFEAQSLIELANKNESFEAFNILLRHSHEKERYIRQFRKEFSICIFYYDILDASKKRNDELLINSFSNIKNSNDQKKIITKLLESNNLYCFFTILNNNPNLTSKLSIPENKSLIKGAFFHTQFISPSRYASDFVNHGLIPLDNHGNLENSFFFEMLIRQEMNSSQEFKEIKFTEEDINSLIFDVREEFSIRGVNVDSLKFNFLNYCLSSYLHFDLITTLASKYDYTNLEFNSNIKSVLNNTNVIQYGNENYSKDYIKLSVLSEILNNHVLTEIFFSKEDVKGDALLEMTFFILGEYMEIQSSYYVPNISLNPKKINNQQDYVLGKDVVTQMINKNFKFDGKKPRTVALLFSTNVHIKKKIYDVEWKKVDKKFWNKVFR